MPKNKLMALRIVLLVLLSIVLCFIVTTFMFPNVDNFDPIFSYNTLTP
jgi:regulatory protein YycH of two-component signal transduction system YycFG